MEPLELSFAQFLTHVVGDMVKAVSRRPGEGKQDVLRRTQVASHLILGLMPRDGLEAMLAGHAVMFHDVMTDTVGDVLRRDADVPGRGPRLSLVALDRCFHRNLDRLDTCHERPSQGTRETVEENRRPDPRSDAADARSAAVPASAANDAPAQTEPRIGVAEVQYGASEIDLPPQLTGAGPRQHAGATPRQHASAAPRQPAGAAPPQLAGAAPRRAPAMRNDQQPRVPLRPEDVVLFQPTPAQIATAHDNPEAMAALLSGDAEQLARALGVELTHPSPDQIAAARANPAAMAALEVGDIDAFSQVMADDPAGGAWLNTVPCWACDPTHPSAGHRPPAIDPPAGPVGDD